VIFSPDLEMRVKSDGKVYCIGFISTLDLMLFLLDSIEKFLVGDKPEMKAFSTSLQMTDISSILDQKDEWASFTVSSSPFSIWSKMILPDTPSQSLATDANLILASSRIFCMRLATAV